VLIAKPLVCPATVAFKLVILLACDVIFPSAVVTLVLNPEMAEALFATFVLAVVILVFKLVIDVA